MTKKVPAKSSHPLKGKQDSLELKIIIDLTLIYRQIWYENIVAENEESSSQKSAVILLCYNN